MMKIKSLRPLTILQSTWTWGINSLAFGTLIAVIWLSILTQIERFDPPTFFISIFSFFYGWVRFFLKFVIGPALVLGFIQAVWFQLENENWGSVRGRQGFSFFSGIIFGLLCFPVDNILCGGFLRSEFFWLALASSFLGGVYGAYANRKNFPPLMENQRETAWTRIVFSYFALVVCLIFLEFIFFGEKTFSEISLMQSMTTTSTETGASQTATPGPEKGIFLSGVFKLSNQSGSYTFGVPEAIGQGAENDILAYENNDDLARIKQYSKPKYSPFIEQIDAFDQSLTIIQNNGELRLKDSLGGEWIGTVDQLGKFKIDGKKTEGDVRPT
jgi:hypothetical protein